MLYGICNLPVIPVRAEPSNRSEMTSQLLFGETFEVLEQTDEYSYVKLTNDDYQGWIDMRQQAEIDEETYLTIKSESQYVADLSTHAMVLKVGMDESLHLLPGSTLPMLIDDSFVINGQEYLFLGLSRMPIKDNFESEIEETAHFYLNAPYLWGGRSVFGVDCSGLMQLLFKHFGVQLKRDAWQQAEGGMVVDFLQEARLGDLAFFDNAEGKIVHVGMLLSETEIIHACGRVRIDRIDNEGIYSREQRKYTHRLRIVKRHL